MGDDDVSDDFNGPLENNVQEIKYPGVTCVQPDGMGDIKNVAKATAVLKACCDEPPQQPDAIERLEAWLAKGENRDVEITRQYQKKQPYWRVMLSGDGLGGPNVFGYESPEAGKTTFYPSYAKEPGLAATIHAAIDRAEELGL